MKSYTLYCNGSGSFQAGSNSLGKHQIEASLPSDENDLRRIAQNNAPIREPKSPLPLFVNSQGYFFCAQCAHRIALQTALDDAGNSRRRVDEHSFNDISPVPLPQLSPVDYAVSIFDRTFIPLSILYFNSTVPHPLASQNRWFDSDANLTMLFQARAAALKFSLTHEAQRYLVADVRYKPALEAAVRCAPGLASAPAEIINVVILESRSLRQGCSLRTMQRDTSKNFINFIITGAASEAPIPISGLASPADSSRTSSRPDSRASSGLVSSASKDYYQREGARLLPPISSRNPSALRDASKTSCWDSFTTCWSWGRWSDGKYYTRFENEDY